MFNVKRIETIRANIKSSTLLSDHEKSDWLNLVELMNDKQLGELEEILNTSPPAASTPEQRAQAHEASVSTRNPQPSAASQLATPSNSDGIAMPPLSHIANMPSDVDMTMSVPKPSKPWVDTEKKPMQPLSARAVPSPSLSFTKPSQQPGVTQQPNTSQSPQAPKPAQPDSAQPKSFVKPEVSPLPPLKPASFAPAPLRPSSTAAFTLPSLENLQELSLETLRSFSPESISNEVRKAITEHGYFTVIQLIEASPLYAEYMNAGKQLLGDPQKSAITNSPVKKSDLTQEEFEFVVDLLRNVRFNRE